MVSTPAAQVADVLRQLGDTADEVAASLRAHGVRGHRNTVHVLNPIVRHVRPLVAGIRGLDVMKRDRLRLVFFDGRQEAVALPQPVQDFLDQFNRGAYPDLEMP